MPLGKEACDALRRRDVVAELSRLARCLAVCFEATTGYGVLYEQLRTVARRVVVAPGQLRLIFRSKRKNDGVDAEKLAKLLFLDEVPPVYVPGADVRSWRQLIDRLFAEGAALRLPAALAEVRKLLG